MAEGEQPRAKSKYIGVSRYNNTGMFVARIWHNENPVVSRRKRHPCKGKCKCGNRGGKQVYLGCYSNKKDAARAHDLAKLKYRGAGPDTKLNFNITDYAKEIELMKTMSPDEFVDYITRSQATCGQMDTTMQPQFNINRKRYNRTFAAASKSPLGPGTYNNIESTNNDKDVLEQPKSPSNVSDIEATEAAAAKAHLGHLGPGTCTNVDSTNNDEDVLEQPRSPTNVSDMEATKAAASKSPLGPSTYNNIESTNNDKDVLEQPKSPSNISDIEATEAAAAKAHLGPGTCTNVDSTNNDEDMLEQPRSPSNISYMEATEAAASKSPLGPGTYNNIESTNNDKDVLEQPKRPSNVSDIEATEAAAAKAHLGPGTCTNVDSTNNDEDVLKQPRSPSNVSDMEDVGLVCPGSVRRSTRKRTTPLREWLGERQVYGRIHDSMPTVIGVKSLRPHQDGKEVLEVESFVCEEYADLVAKCPMY
ncbi:hypothetical protein ACP4OV_025769 [Aristida adscensionis]